MALTDENGSAAECGPRESRRAAALRRASARGVRLERAPAPPARTFQGRPTSAALAWAVRRERDECREALGAAHASRRAARCLAAASEFEVVERRIDVAARAQFLGVLSGDRRTVRAIVDFREQLDRLLVRAVARGVRVELAGVVEGHGYAHVSLRGNAQLI